MAKHIHMKSKKKDNTHTHRNHMDELTKSCPDRMADRLKRREKKQQQQIHSNKREREREKLKHNTAKNKKTGDVFGW